MNTVTIKIKDGILKVASIPDDTRVVLADVDAGMETTYKKEENGRVWKKRRRI